MIFDKKTENQADIAVTVANSGVTSVKNGNSTISANNYTDTNGVITIKKEYLSTLTVGEKTFTFITEDKTNPICKITIIESE